MISLQQYSGAETYIKILNYNWNYKEKKPLILNGVVL